MCNQAHGSRGQRCSRCRHIDFEVPDQEYVEKLPAWCDHKLRPFNKQLVDL